MLPNNSKVFIYHKPIDMRKGMNRLAIFIEDELALSPNDGSIYIFYNKNYNKLKFIYWDQNGFCLFYKTLEKEHFKIPKIIALRTISHQQMRWLFEGLDINEITGFKELKYTTHF